MDGNTLMFLMFVTMAVVIGIASIKAQAQQTSLVKSDSILQGIQDRAELVTFISETDSDVNVTVAGRNIETLDETTFIQAFPFQAAYQPIEQFELADFAERFEKQADFVQWIGLFDYLSMYLSDVKVFRAGGVRGEYFVIGLLEGRVVGVRMFSVDS